MCCVQEAISQRLFYISKMKIVRIRGIHIEMGG